MGDEGIPLTSLAGRSGGYGAAYVSGGSGSSDDGGGGDGSGDGSGGGGGDGGGSGGGGGRPPSAWSGFAVMVLLAAVASRFALRLELRTFGLGITAGGVALWCGLRGRRHLGRPPPAAAAAASSVRPSSSNELLLHLARSASAGMLTALGVDGGTSAHLVQQLATQQLATVPGSPAGVELSGAQRERRGLRGAPPEFRLDEEGGGNDDDDDEDDGSLLTRDALLRVVAGALPVALAMQMEIAAEAERGGGGGGGGKRKAGTLCGWQRAYSLEQHGADLGTLYAAAAAQAHRQIAQGWAPELLLVVEDSTGALFGGFVSGANLRGVGRKAGAGGSASFEGDASCFVFRLFPCPTTFAATGANSCYMLAAEDRLAMGAGDGHCDTGSSAAKAGGFAFCLDESLCRGTCSSSATFGNDQLASEEIFTCVSAELWVWVGLSAACS